MSGTQFTCFTGTAVQILTPEEPRGACLFFAPDFFLFREGARMRLLPRPKSEMFIKEEKKGTDTMVQLESWQVDTPALLLGLLLN